MADNRECSDYSSDYSSSSSEVSENISEREFSDESALSSEIEVGEMGPDMDVFNAAEPPYLYEPDASDDDEDGARPDNRPDRISRLDVHRFNEWCTCTHCQILTTEPECVCCSEIDVVAGKIRELEGYDSREYNCITDTDGFKGVCLHVWVLQTAWSGYRNQYGRRAFEGQTNDKYRHIAYRQFVRWCWGFCGPKIRVTLPSCVVSCIRAHFPKDGDEEFAIYKGFRLPKLDD
ncbi:uncharacterized protein LOC141911561 [Tubulanus polymorphus]|uniref:uncharacterized protein LOC141911561 n=1 Tax=Tubulanus polymorphus TaxID=672921 RepID=UPI003DA39232